MSTVTTNEQEINDDDHHHHNHGVIQFERPVYTQNSLKHKYAFSSDHHKLAVQEDNEIFKNTKHYLIKHFKPNRSCMLNFLFDLFPIIKWIPKYDVRKDVFKDLIAGLTVGVIQVSGSFFLFLI